MNTKFELGDVVYPRNELGLCSPSKMVVVGKDISLDNGVYCACMSGDSGRVCVKSYLEKDLISASPCVPNGSLKHEHVVHGRKLHVRIGEKWEGSSLVIPHPCTGFVREVAYYTRDYAVCVDVEVWSSQIKKSCCE